MEVSGNMGSSCGLWAHCFVALPGECDSLEAIRAAIGDRTIEEARDELARRVRGLLAGVQKEGESASVCEQLGSGGVAAGPSWWNEADRFLVVVVVGGVVGSEVDTVRLVEARERGLSSKGEMAECGESSDVSWCWLEAEFRSLASVTGDRVEGGSRRCGGGGSGGGADVGGALVAWAVQVVLISGTADVFWALWCAVPTEEGVESIPAGPE